MNERIRKLVVQSEIQFHNLSTGNGDNWQFTGKSEDLEKFAELIVKECTNVLRQEWFDENNRVIEEGPRDVAMQVGRKNALIKAINKVKEHFGVK